MNGTNKRNLALLMIAAAFCAILMVGTAYAAIVSSVAYEDEEVGFDKVELDITSSGTTATKLLNENVSLPYTVKKTVNNGTITTKYNVDSATAYVISDGKKMKIVDEYNDSTIARTYQITMTIDSSSDKLSYEITLSKSGTPLVITGTSSPFTATVQMDAGVTEVECDLVIKATPTGYTGDLDAVPSAVTVSFGFSAAMI